jgi:hypothetical protein
MHEELEHFERNQLWELVEPPQNYKPIGTKRVWKNKEGENGEAVRSKSRLVAQGYSHWTEAQIPCSYHMSNPLINMVIP